ncbi:MAG: DUF1501 domain-containing protein [Phycisphaerae bacterium]
MNPTIQTSRSCSGCREYRELAQQLRLTAPISAIRMSRPQARVPRVVLNNHYSSTRDAMLVIFLRGGMDGLTTVVPYGDPNLYAANLRPNLAVPPPGQNGGAVDLDGFFGLAPAMNALLPAYQNNDLLIVHATGSPDPTRSHFDAFQYMEYGIPLQPLSLFTGWLGRHLQSTPPMSNGPLRGVALNYLVPKTLAGAPGTLPIPDPANYAFPGRPESSPLREEALTDMVEATQEPVKSAGLNTMNTIDLLESIDFDNYVPGNGAVYPQTGFGDAVRSAAALIKAEIGVEVAMVELGGWDTHAQQQGQINNLMFDLSQAMAAFHADTQDTANPVTTIAMSEFGRRADANGSAGTDHGHGNCMMVMGSGINGGQVIADWTDNALLHPDNLYQGDSLDVTIDYRDIIAEILQERMENIDLASVFPNFTPTMRGVTI